MNGEPNGTMGCSEVDGTAGRYPSLHITSDGEDWARVDASCFRPVLDLTSDELRSLRRAAARADNGRWFMNQANPRRTTEL